MQKENQDKTTGMPATLRPTLARTVHFTPPGGCRNPNTPEQYAAIITQVNPDGTAELATFGPNSLYFQHNIPWSEAPAEGCWNWPPRI